MCYDVRDVPCEHGITIDGDKPFEMEEVAYCTFTIPESALQGRLDDLIERYAYPSAISIARSIDIVFNRGVIRKLSSSLLTTRFPTPSRKTCVETLKDARHTLDENGASGVGRHLIMDTDLETNLLMSGCPVENIAGFHGWLDYSTPISLAWQEEAIILVSQPPVTESQLSIFVKVRDQIGLQISIQPKEDSLGYNFSVESHIGVKVPHPEFAVLIGEV